MIGISKGRGFAGVVRRHHFRGGEVARIHVPGAGFDRRIRFPSRVFPGMRMGGHMGEDAVTVRNLEFAASISKTTCWW